MLPTPICAGAESGRACRRADPRGSDGRLGGAREDAALGLRLPRCIDACACLPREGRPHGEAEPEAEGRGPLFFGHWGRREQWFGNER